MYIFDSREKKNEHIKVYFDKHNIPYKVECLNVGDYQIEGNPKISVDRKQNLNEFSKNLMNAKDRFRLFKEVRRARDQGVHLVFLIEHGTKIKCIEDVKYWDDKYSGVKGRDLMEAIYRFHQGYGCDIIFCSKRQTAKKIIEILGGWENEKNKM